MVTRERFEQGMTIAEYLDRMRMNRERFVQLLGEVTLTAEDRPVLARPGRPLHVLVITEDWCGDSLRNLPVLVKMVEGHPDIRLRVFLRDENPDVMDQFLKRGVHRAIPVFAFLDEDMKEVARFTERPPARAEWRRDAIEHLKILLQA